MTPNGKVDRRRLPIPVTAENPASHFEAPATPVEVAIAEIWTELIQPARTIGRYDKFFEMGGHSLLALRALRQMEQRLGWKLDLRVLLLEHLADIAIRRHSQSPAQAGAQPGGGDGGPTGSVIRG